jgi:hypothetical protein
MIPREEATVHLMSHSLARGQDQRFLHWLYPME